MTEALTATSSLAWRRRSRKARWYTPLRRRKRPLSGLSKLPRPDRDRLSNARHGRSGVHKRARNSANGADVPIIVITAYDDRAFRLQALEAGATDFLRSPVDHYEFTTRARNLLKLQRQQQHIKGRALALEQQLRISERSQEELVRSSREALAQVIDTVPAMISATDEDGRIVFVNAHFAEFVNSTPEALLRRYLAMPSFVATRSNSASRFIDPF